MRSCQVAGGKGALASALSLRKLRVVVVEPRPGAAELEHEDAEGEDDLIEASAVSTQTAESVERICAEFDAESFKTLVGSCQAMVAMHPDEATDAVIDSALKAERPFAVVPCCVFPRLFNSRRLFGGGGVTTYMGLIRFLREKDGRIQAARLPFQGRNIVLYMKKEDS